jgi:hypothetical protein
VAVDTDESVVANRGMAVRAQVDKSDCSIICEFNRHCYLYAFRMNAVNVCFNLRNQLHRPTGIDKLGVNAPIEA